MPSKREAQAAIDDDDLTDDPAGESTAKKDHDVGQLPSPAQATGRSSSDGLRDERFVVGMGANGGLLEDASRNSVDLNPLRRQLDSHITHRRLESRLGHADGAIARDD